MSGTSDATQLTHAILSILYRRRQGVTPSCIGREESFCTGRRHPCIGVYPYARTGPASDSDAGFLFSKTTPSSCGLQGWAQANQPNDRKKSTGSPIRHQARGRKAISFFIMGGIAQSGEEQQAFTLRCVVSQSTASTNVR